MAARAHKISTITFDADGTLWDFQFAMRRALRDSLRKLERLGYDVRGLKPSHMIQHREAVARRREHQGAKMEDLRLAAFTHTLKTLGIRDDALARDLTEHYLERRFRYLTPYRDVPQTLRRLGKSFKLGIVSNGNSYPEHAGLGELFSFTVFAHDHGVAKPDPAIFRVALDVAHEPAGHVLHVGDRIDNDILPARAAGLHALWLNREAEDLPRTVGPIATIYRLTELVNYLGV